jgi:hypothetical protein
VGLRISVVVAFLTPALLVVVLAGFLSRVLFSALLF